MSRLRISNADACADESRDTPLVLGSLSRAEERALKKLVPTSLCWSRTDNLAEACAEVVDGAVSRVLLLQSRPGEIPHDVPEKLRRADLEIELLSVAGSWCEGELRTGQPWTDVPRVYWHDFAATESEGQSRADVRSTVLVSTRDYDSASAWIDVLADQGCAAFWAPSCQCEPLGKGERLAVWEGGQLDGHEANRLAAFCRRRRVSGAAVVAVLDFPRADAVETALDCGAAAVLGRPWQVEHVESLVNQLVKPPTLIPTTNAWQAEQFGRAA